MEMLLSVSPSPKMDNSEDLLMNPKFLASLPRELLDVSLGGVDLPKIEITPPPPPSPPPSRPTVPMPFRVTITDDTPLFEQEYSSYGDDEIENVRPPPKWRRVLDRVREFYGAHRMLIWLIYLLVVVIWIIILASKN